MNAYNFSEPVRIVLAIAREEAVKLGDTYVMPDHIGLALLSQQQGMCAAILNHLGTNPQALRDVVAERMAQRRREEAAEAGADLPYTSASKNVLELTMKEARQLQQSYIGTEHLLLGIAREADNATASVLADHGLTLERLRDEVARVAEKSLPGPVTHAMDSLQHLSRRLRSVQRLAALALALSLLALAIAIVRR